VGGGIALDINESNEALLKTTRLAHFIIGYTEKLMSQRTLC